MRSPLFACPDIICYVRAQALGMCSHLCCSHLHVVLERTALLSFLKEEPFLQEGLLLELLCNYTSCIIIWFSSSIALQEIRTSSITTSISPLLSQPPHRIRTINISLDLNIIQILISTSNSKLVSCYLFNMCSI